MTQPSRLRLVDPSTLANVWKVDDFASEEKVVPTGHTALDRHLPGGGWPLGQMVEVLHRRADQHVWQLVLPALVQVIEACKGPVVLVGAPHEPFGPSLQAQGLPANRLLMVKAGRNTACLWATEQSLKCAEVAAVIAWLPQARTSELRRLQMAAHQQGRLVFVFRDEKAINESSPARLRVLVEGNEELKLRILKRRGPPLETEVKLSATPKKLSALLASRRSRAPTLPAPAAVPSITRRSHVLDRAPAHT